MADILSQEEIDALLEIIEYDNNDKINAENNEIPYKKQVTLYDFKRPNRINKEQLELLRGIHDKMARNLSSQISTIMRSVVEIQLHSVEQMTYGEFLINVPSPTSFNIFSMKPLNGSGVLEISHSIAFSMLDKLLGGNGEPYKNIREFTEIELNVLDIILQQIMRDLKDIWAPIVEIIPTIYAKESSPNIMRIASQNEIVIIIAMDIKIGKNRGVLNLCYPVISLESILYRLINRDLIIHKLDIKNSRNKELRVLLGGALVNISAILGSTKLTLDDILKLQVGDIIRLDKVADDTIIINIDNKDKYIGEIGLQRYRKTLKIKDIIESKNDKVKEMLEKLEHDRKHRVENIKENTK